MYTYKTKEWRNVYRHRRNHSKMSRAAYISKHYSLILMIKKHSL